MSGRPVKGAAYTELVAGVEFVVLDIETTYVKATRTAGSARLPISIGAVTMLNGSRRDIFHTLVNPGVPVDKESSAYNGIRSRDITPPDVPDVAGALGLLDVFLAAHPDAVIVCHNAMFDVGHLHEAYVREQMAPFDRLVIDTEFLGMRLRLPGVAAFAKLTDLARRYSIDTTAPVPSAQRRLHKALKDAQDTAEVLDQFIAEAAALGITDWAAFCDKAKPRRSLDIAGSTRRRRRMRPPDIPAAHIKACHNVTPLPAAPGGDALAAWDKQIAACVKLHCPTIAEKVQFDSGHAALLLARLTAMMASTRDPGDMGTLLVALEPLLSQMDRPASRDWYKANAQHIRDSKPCEPYAACPACLAELPCLRDTVYQLLTRLTLNYGTTGRGGPVSLLSKQAKKDLWSGKSARKIDTWPNAGVADMAAHMVWLVIQEARAKRQQTTVTKLLASAVQRDLHFADPHLALEVARHWSRTPARDGDVRNLATTVLAGATSAPGYLELEVWYNGAFQRTLEARQTAATRAAKPRKLEPKRTPSSLELRPEAARHAYRYQLHRTG